MDISNYARKRGMSDSRMRILHTRILLVLAGALAGALVVASLVLSASMKPAEAAFPGENGKIVFDSDRTKGDGVDNPEGDPEIFTINQDGKGLTQLTRNSVNDVDPTYSPDGGWIAFTSYRNGDSEIHKMRSDGSGQTKLTTNDASEIDPAWSPDGNRIVFASDRDGNAEIYKMRSDGRNQIRLTNNTVEDDSPVYSPILGDKIAFERGPFYNAEIYTMSPDGSEQTDITDGRFPNWSPDGKQIAFTRDPTNSKSTYYQIYKMRPDGSGQEDLTGDLDGIYAGRDPAWSPDGKQIVFLGFSINRKPDIYKMRDGGRGLTPLTKDTRIGSDGSILRSGIDWRPR